VECILGINAMLNPLSGASLNAETGPTFPHEALELCGLVQLKLRKLQEKIPFLVVAPALPQWNCF
jgi:hypothetical protein